MKEQSLWDEIQSMPNDKHYKFLPNFPIPLGKSVLVKRAPKEQIVVIPGTLIIPDTAAENSQPPKVGIIISVGPLCTKGVRVGLRVAFNHFCDLEMPIGVDKYIMMEESDIYYILRDNQTTSQGLGVKPAKEVRRAKSIDKNDSYRERKYKKDQNEKDEKFDKTKGKIFSVTKK